MPRDVVTHSQVTPQFKPKPSTSGPAQYWKPAQTKRYDYLSARGRPQLAGRVGRLCGEDAAEPRLRRQQGAVGVGGAHPGVEVVEAAAGKNKKKIQLIRCEENGNRGIYLSIYWLGLDYTFTKTEVRQAFGPGPYLSLSILYLYTAI